MSTLSFETFWAWVQQHSNCLVRVGTSESMLYDDEDFHWYIGPDRSELVVQMIRGKRLMGEILVDPEKVTYIQALGEERQGEHVFEAILETPVDRMASYTFVLTHGLEENTPESPAPESAHGRLVH